MLTLQDILGSDSFSTAIQKINENFKSISLSGGGPQGIRGEQGLPGLPGKQGSTGPQGPSGTNGNSVDILPFGTTAGPFTGPTVGPAVGQVSWPIASLTWLQQNYGDTGGTFTPTIGMVVIDHNNFAYWQYQDGLQTIPYPPLGPLNPGARDEDASYQIGIYTGASWTGPGWYYYPSDLSSLVASLTDVWVNDYTTYLTNPTDYDYTSPQANTFNTPYSIPRARLKTKYGVIWVSSHNSTPGTSGPNASSSLSNDSSVIKDTNFGGYSERTAGVDRLLFKFSLDGRPVYENVASQSYTGPLPALNDITQTIEPPVNDVYNNAYINPIYRTSIAKYSPLLYLAPWTEENENTAGIDAISKGNLGIFGYQAPEDAPGETPIQIWILSHRTQSIPDNIAVTYPSSRNAGHFLIDSRRTITSNQYAVLPSQDSSPIDEITFITTNVGTSTITSATLENESGPYVYQGYHSLINGSFINNDEYQRSYFKDAIEVTFSGPWVSSPSSIVNNQLEYPNGYKDTANTRINISLFKRSSWFGSSIHSSDPGEESTLVATNEYIRSAGMMERDRALIYNPVANPAAQEIVRGNELIFYTARTEELQIIDPLNPYDQGVDENLLSSKAVLYMSPSRNVGITTVPRSSLKELGIVEPHGRLHTHVIKNLDNERSVNGTVTVSGAGKTNKYSLIGTFSSANAESVSDIGNYSVVKIGRAVSPQYQSEIDIFTDFEAIPQGGIRYETYDVTGSSRLRNTGALQFGIGLGQNNPIYEINSNESNFVNEWILSISPISNGATGPISDDHSDRGRYVAGVGIQERFPRTRFHMYGQNNAYVIGESGPFDPEGLYGRATYSATGPVPSGNTKANRQVSIDYVENSWIVSAGILDYGYASGANIINYPYTEGLRPRLVYGTGPQTSNNKFTTTTGPATSNDGDAKPNGLWFPGGIAQTPSVSTTTHGGNLHAQFPITQYQGFNLIRDLSFYGDDKDVTTWKTGSDGTNNGAVGFVTDSFGDIGLVNIPRWRDGGSGAGRYEQRNIGQRDVLNNMKIFFSADGNVGVGGKPGLDENAYPSKYKNTSGLNVNKVYYLSSTTGTGPSPATVFYTGPGAYRLAAVPPVPAIAPTWGGVIVGKTSYLAPYNVQYGAAWVNSSTTQSETVRFEIGASKLFEAPGRILQNRGWGYPVGRNTVSGPTAYIDLKFTVWKSTNESGAKYSDICKASTDSEGRITKLFFANTAAIITALGGGLAQTSDRILLQHPTELSIPGYTPPIGAIAPGITTTVFTNTAVTITWDEKVLAPANLRINNFIGGEGESFLGAGGTSLPGGYIGSTDLANDDTVTKSRDLRRQSPKIILTYEGIDPDRGEGSSIKVNTIIRSAQNVSSYREFWIPKSDNAGATLMAFTSHFETEAKNDSIDRKSIKKERIAIEEITYVALDYDYGGRSTYYKAGVSKTVGLFHPTYIKYDYNLNNVGVDWTGPFGESSSPDAINPFPSTFDSSSYGQYYSASGGIKQTLHPLRAVVATGPIPKGFRHAVEVVKTGGQEGRDTPTQIRFRRINSDWAMMDYNVTLKVNDAFDLGLGATGPSDAMTGPITGDFEYNIQRRGLWWLQHVKIRFDLDSGMVLGTPSVTATNTPDYHATAYDRGLGFRMWSDYNQWNNGNAVAHPGVADYVRYKTNPFGKTYPQNSWNWNPYMGDFLNGNSRLTLESTPTQGILVPSTNVIQWVTNVVGSPYVLSTTDTAIPAVGYDRVIEFDRETLTNIVTESTIRVLIETGFNTGIYNTAIDNLGVGAVSVPLRCEIPANCRFKIRLKDNNPAPTGGINLSFNVYRRGSTFSTEYHKLVKNTGFDWGLSSTKGVLLPFVQALRNRTNFDGTWTDIYNETDGYTGLSSVNLENLMRQTWATFGNNAFMKTKTTQWRVTPYNDPGTRGGQYELSDGIDFSPIAALPTVQGVPVTNAITGPGPYQGGKENSFYLEVIIPDAILHDPVGGFGTWEAGVTNKSTAAELKAGFTEARAYRYVTLSGQAMVNFQEITKHTTYAEINPNSPNDLGGGGLPSA